MGQLKPFLAPDFDGDVEMFWRDEGDGTSSIVSQQDVGAMLEHNKELANSGDGYSPSRELRRVAFIPDIIALKWLHEEGWWVYDPNAKRQLARKLNDPDWRYLRTAPGQVAHVNGRIR